MNCFECAIRGEVVPAVATCPRCNVGMCLEHLAEAQRYRVGGTTFGCPHDLSLAAPIHTAAPVLHGNGDVREVVGSPR